MSHGDLVQLSVFDYSLTPVRVDRLSLVFGYIFHIAAFLGMIFALRVKDTGQHVAAFAYAGSAIGAVFRGRLDHALRLLGDGRGLLRLLDLGTPQRAVVSGRHALLDLPITSGVLLLAGALAHVHETGSLAFDYLGLSGLGGWLIFIAFGIKCAFPLLHNWLEDAYPEATVTGTVFLSAFTTKMAIYALARGYPGTELLVWIGVTMTAFPIFFAVIVNDLRRVLTYSMNNQLGFMVVGSASVPSWHSTAPLLTRSPTFSSRVCFSCRWGRCCYAPAR